MRVGILRTENLVANPEFSSTLVLPTLRPPFISCARSSTTGAISLHGTHQLAQKSTRTGSLEFTTSFSKLDSLNSTATSLPPYLFTITFVGHTSKHFPIFSHFAQSIRARLLSTFIAPVGQAFSHFLQAMQPDLQTFATMAPGS